MSNETTLSKLEKLVQLLKQNEASLVVNNARKLLFSGDISAIQNALQEINITTTTDVDGYVFDLTNFFHGYKIIYYKWIDQDLDGSIVDENLLIISTNGKVSLAKNGIVENTIGGTEFENEISNILNYYHLRNLLKTETLSDHHNEIKEEYVFYSSTKGVIKIKYDTRAPHIPDANYTLVTKSLTTLISDSQYKSYFVNSLFKIAHERPSIELIEIIKISDQLIGVIKRDYELVLKQFDFEKFKDKLLKEKDKYFSSIREILNKVFSQLVSIPISISASVFATYKVENEPVTLMLILVGFIFYIIIYVKIQSIYKQDINELELDFNRDFEIIKNQSGLPSEVINSESNKIRNKISQTRSMINILIIAILILGMSFVLYLGNQIVISFFEHHTFLFLIARRFFSC